MAKKAAAQVIETLKAENEKLATELKQKIGEFEYTQKWYKSCQEEIDRCHKLLDMSAYAPKNGEEYHEGNLSVRIMGLLLAVERSITVVLRINESMIETKGE